MGDLAAILLTAACGLVASIAIWIASARLLLRRGLSSWRAAPVGLTLTLAASAYGLYWLAFFASPASAVQAHAMRLILTYALGAMAPWLAAGWLALAVLPLLPLARR